MNVKPKVLIFDDEIEWATSIEMYITDRYDSTIVTSAEGWNSRIAPSFWDAIVADAQILGSAKTGFEIAEDAILTLGIKSPIIIITNKVDIESIKKTKKDLFFSYLSKADPSFSEKLLTEIDRACASTKDSSHICNLLTGVGSELKIFDKKLSDEAIGVWKSELELYGFSLSSNIVTFKGLVDLIKDGETSKVQKERIQKLLWEVVRDARESQYR